MIRLTSEYGNFRPSSFIFMSTFVPNSNNIRMEHFYIYILPSKQLSDVVKKKENLPSIDSRTPISQQFAAFMIIFEGLWSFQLANLIFQEML